MLETHMSNTPHESTAAADDGFDPLAERALEWIVFLHSGDETEQDWQEYETWKHASDKQYIACAQAEALWSSIGPAVERPRSIRRIGQALAVLVLVGGLGFAGVESKLISSPASLMADYRTPVHQGQKITLDDGSQLYLDASTQVDIEFSTQQRQIILHGGQLHIDVASDKKRPLLVIADDISVRALGTGFNVKYTPGQIGVTVTEHSVLVKDHEVSGSETPSAELHRGQQLAYSPESGLGQVHPADLNAILAWQKSRLVFDNQPLNNVIQDMQRYSSDKLIVLGEELKQKRITGVFDTQDLDNVLHAIELEFDVKIHRIPGMILIRQ